LIEVCSWITGDNAAAGKEHVRPIVSRLRSNSDVRELTAIVGRLQRERHRADYDHLATFEKWEVLALVEEAERALRLLKQLDGSADFESFLALIGLHAPTLR
jgi:hypothetical protein